MNAIQAMAEAIIEPMTPAERKQRQRNLTKDRGGLRVDALLSMEETIIVRQVCRDHDCTIRDAMRLLITGKANP